MKIKTKQKLLGFALIILAVIIIYQMRNPIIVSKKVPVHVPIQVPVEIPMEKEYQKSTNQRI